MVKVIIDWDVKYHKCIIVSDHLDVIREHFSAKNESAKFLKMKMGPLAFIKDRDYVIKPSGRFDSGLFFEIVKFLKGDNNQYDIIITDLLKDNLLNAYNIPETEIAKLRIPLREYQNQTICRALYFGMGNIVIGTAGGKTLTMATLIETILSHQPTTCLVVLPAQLVEQTYTDFISYGIDPERITKWVGEIDLNNIPPIIVASSKTLETQLVTFKTIKDELKENTKLRQKQWKKRKDKLLNIFDTIDLVLIDEVHGLRKDNTLNRIIDYLKTIHKYGFTGTMPEEKIDEWNIIGKIGPIIKEVTSVQLREEHYTSSVYANLIKIDYVNKPERIVGKSENIIDAYKKECEFIIRNKYRNHVICSIANKLDNNILILVNSLEQGEILFEKLKWNNSNKIVYFIKGEVPTTEREQVRTVMEEHNNIICIAMSKIFATGINITNIHYILFALAGKAKIRMLQSIGRGLRLHKDKISLEIFDIVDNLHYSMKHFEKRMFYYTKEKIPHVTKNLHEHHINIG